MQAFIRLVFVLGLLLVCWNSYALEVLVYATQPVKARPDVYVMTTFEADSEVDEPKNGYLTKVFSVNYPKVIFDQRRDYDDFPDVHHDYLVQQIARRYEKTGQFTLSVPYIIKKLKWSPKKRPATMPTIVEDDEKVDAE